MREFIVLVLAIAASIFLVLGLTQPVIKLTRLYFWTDVHSIVSVINALYYTKEFFLAGVIVVFSILFPLFKIIYIALITTFQTNDPNVNARWLKRLGWLGKWSMLDVLVLALLVFYAKQTQLADAVALPGIYYFALSVALTMVAYGLIQSHGKPK